MMNSQHQVHHKREERTNTLNFEIVQWYVERTNSGEIMINNAMLTLPQDSVNFEVYYYGEMSSKHTFRRHYLSMAAKAAKIRDSKSKIQKEYIEIYKNSQKSVVTISNDCMTVLQFLWRNLCYFFFSKFSDDRKFVFNAEMYQFLTLSSKVCKGERFYIHLEFHTITSVNKIFGPNFGM